MTWNGCAQVKFTNQNGVLIYSNDNINGYVISFRDITDGSSNTFVCGEVTISQSVTPSNSGDGDFPTWLGGTNNAGCNGWSDGGSALRITNAAMSINLWKRPVGGVIPVESDAAFGSQHVGGSQFLMGDGTVKFVSENIDLNVYQNLGGRNEGGAIGDI